MSEHDKHQTHTGDFHDMQADAYDAILLEGKRQIVIAKYCDGFPTEKAAGQ